MPCPDAQTYIMKLARSGEDGEKVHVVLESGVRFHSTQVPAPACAFGLPAVMMAYADSRHMHYHACHRTPITFSILEQGLSA